MPAPDVLIVGGGVIGLSTAWELARRGHAVRLLERDVVGPPAGVSNWTGVASWAGAGMLPPASAEHAVRPLDRLRALSHTLWDHWAETLHDASGVNTGYERCGLIQMALHVGDGSSPTDDPTDRLRATQSPGVRWEPAEIGGPNGPPRAFDVSGAVRFPDAGQVRNPRLLKALRAACVTAGVDLREGAAVRSVLIDGRRTVGVRTDDGDEPAGAVLVCGGAWSGGLLRTVGFCPPVEPVRGQMVLLRCGERPFRPILQVRSLYVVPRADGRVLVGATTEQVGFAPYTTLWGVDHLIRFVRTVAPGLVDAEVERTWAGLRPGTPDGCPLLGPVPHIDGGFYDHLHVAAGHTREGLQQSPGTAVVMADLLEKKSPAISPEGFSADRFPDGAW